MKDVRIINQSSSSIFIFLLISILFVIVHSAKSSESFINSENSASDPVMDSSVVDDNEDWLLTPGYTKSLLIRLTGRVEEILFEFRAEEVASFTYEVFTIFNKIAESQQIKQFLQEETFNVRFEYDSKEVYIIGDNDFSILYPIHEDNYEVHVTQERFSKVNRQTVMVAQANSGSNTTVIFSTIGGSCGLIALTLAFAVMWKKRKTIKKENLPGRNAEMPVSAQKSTTETPYASQQFTTEQMKKEKKCELKISSKESDSEISAKLRLDCKGKKDSSNSQASTLTTMGRLESQESTKSFLGCNLREISEGENLCETDFETITEVGNEEKNSPYGSILAKPGAQNKKLVIKNNQTILNSQEVAKKIEKPMVKRKSKSLIELEVALDMDFEVDTGERRMPTLTEIKSLVRKMEEEGTIGNDYDLSEDTDDEDQYEAPKLPNYFCCMLCFEGRRCTVVEPCRHVFACNDCVKELLNSYKICVLCANTITSYEPL